jgi:hypothetical protein
MKTKPTWTRYGGGVIMMRKYPAPKNKPGEREQQSPPSPSGKPLDPQKS